MKQPFLQTLPAKSWLGFKKIDTTLHVWQNLKSYYFLIRSRISYDWEEGTRKVTPMKKHSYNILVTTSQKKITMNAKFNYLFNYIDTFINFIRNNLLLCYYQCLTIWPDEPFLDCYKWSATLSYHSVLSLSCNLQSLC